MAIIPLSRWNFLKPAALLFGLLVLFASCSQNEVKIQADNDTKQAIRELINEGSLLNKIEEEGKDYLFSFETRDLKIPHTAIKEIIPDSAYWKTTLIFPDDTRLTVPSKGGSLDFIINRVKVNPSGYNPLAARVDVNLPAYGRVKVTVLGKNDANGTLTHLCQSLTPNQSVPIFGLYPDYNNKVKLTFTDKDGNERGSVQLNIQTEALNNRNIPQFQVIKSQPENMEPGINLVNYPGASELDVSIPYMVDNEGEIRWILFLDSSPELSNLSISSGLKRAKDGSFLTADQNQQRVVKFDMFGNLIKQWDLKKLGYTFHHDITEAANGDFLITVTKTTAQLTNGRPRVKDHIIELNPQSGSVVKEWDLANLADTSRYLKPDGITPPQFSQNPSNWAHNNAIIEFDNDLLATMRYQGIIGFSHAGHLKWIISPHKYWSKKFQPYLLQPVDESGNLITDSAVIMGDASTDGFDWPWGPHTPVALSKDRFIVFDNGYNRNWVSNALTPTRNYSRVVEYKIDRNAGTVQQLWAFGKNRGPGCFSEALSGVQYLQSTGHVLFCPGMGVPTQKGLGGHVIEIDPKTNNVVFELEITVPSNTAFHRVTRMSLYPDNI